MMKTDLFTKEKYFCYIVKFKSTSISSYKEVIVFVLLIIEQFRKFCSITSDTFKHAFTLFLLVWIRYCTVDLPCILCEIRGCVNKITTITTEISNCSHLKGILRIRKFIEIDNVCFTTLLTIS